MRRSIQPVRSAIAGNPGPATFANTLHAFDASRRLNTRIDHLLGNLTVSETSPELQTVEREMAPRLAANENAMMRICPPHIGHSSGNTS